MSGSVELPWAYALAHLGIMLELRGGLLGRLGPSMLALCWPSSGTMLRLCCVCWVVVGLCWPSLGLYWAWLGRLGPMLAQLGTMLGVPGSYVWDYIGFGWAVLGLCWPSLGLCWAFLGSMLGHVGSVLAYLGAMLRRLGTMKGHQRAKVVWKHVPSHFFTVFAVFFTHSTF